MAFVGGGQGLPRPGHGWFQTAPQQTHHRLKPTPSAKLLAQLYPEKDRHLSMSPHQSMYFPEMSAACGGPMLKHRKKVGRKEQQQETAM